jgi:hypothetical protein
VLENCVKQQFDGTNSEPAHFILCKMDMPAGQSRDAVTTHLQGTPKLTLSEIKSRLAKPLLEGIDAQAQWRKVIEIQIS